MLKKLHMLDLKRSGDERTHVSQKGAIAVRKSAYASPGAVFQLNVLHELSRSSNGALEFCCSMIGKPFLESGHGCDTC